MVCNLRNCGKAILANVPKSWMEHNGEMPRGEEEGLLKEHHRKTINPIDDRSSHYEFIVYHPPVEELGNIIGTVEVHRDPDLVLSFTCLYDPSN